MGSRPSEPYLRTIEDDTRKTRLLSLEDVVSDDSVNKNHGSTKIKEEETGDEIQEYAATTMSELLGWYGYEKVDSGCTRSLNLDHFTSDSERKQLSEMDRAFITDARSPRSPLAISGSCSTSFELPVLPMSYGTELKHLGSVPISPSLSIKTVPLHAPSRFLHTNYSISACSDNRMSCLWCGQTNQTCEAARSKPQSYKMVNIPGQFCSEACFAAGRRVALDRVRTCDWCRHVRNPLSYVDLQDGESLLQFCSDKCLNQYKMNIFCHETQAHLTLHGLDSISFHDSEKSGLITPELWFRNCQSPSQSSTDEVLIVDDHLSESLSMSPRENTSKEKEQLSIKLSKGKDSVSIRKHEKTGVCSNKKNNVHNRENENEIGVHLIKQSPITEEAQRFCCLSNESAHWRIRCSGSNVLCCARTASSKNLQNVCTSANYDSCNYHGEESFSRESNIYVKDLRELQKKRELNHVDGVIKTDSWLNHSNNPTMQFNKVPSSLKGFVGEPSQLRYQQQRDAYPRLSPFLMMRTVESEQPKSLIHSSNSSLSPPVTVLIPCPIPIPIPVPIPVPTTVLDMLMSSKQQTSTSETTANKNMSKCEDPAESKNLEAERSQFSTNTKESKNLLRVMSTSSRCCFAQSSSSHCSRNTDSASCGSNEARNNARSLRNRKRSRENSERRNIQLKRRNKFVIA